MLSILLVLIPIFALIFAGWLARRTGALGPQATSELNRYVVYLALPALLFDIVAHAKWADIWQPGFVAAFGLSAIVIFAATVLLRRRRAIHLADVSIDALNASYSNTGYIGFPLALVALGPAAMPATSLAAIMTMFLFATGIVLIEIALQPETRRARLVAQVALSLPRNPLLVAPALGVIVSLLGLSLPTPVNTFLAMLGGSASPCALVALGLVLAAKHEAGSRPNDVTTLLVALKLIVQPVLAWGLASVIFHLPPLLTHTAVLMAALPTGTGPFMLAEFYEREVGVTSTVVLVSTVVSIFTVSGYLAFAV